MGTARHKPSNEKARPSAKSLAGKRILIVEDEPFLALDITAQLEDAGAIVVGPAGNTAHALRLTEEVRFDAALLDANLDGRSVENVAISLDAKSVPFIFISGYGCESLPKAFADAGLLPKPFAVERLLAVTAQLVS